MSLKLFLLVAVLTVAATQAAQPRFRGGVGIATGSGSAGKACYKYNAPARMRMTPNTAFFKKNCESVAACEWSDGMCGVKPAPAPTQKAKPAPKPKPLVPATADECKLANAGPTATSAEAKQLCGAAEGCKYFVKSSTNFRCCYHKDGDKISSCDTPSPKGAFPVPDPAMKPAAKCDGTCCSDPDKIDADMAGSELGGGKCKLGADKKCKRTDDTTIPCLSQIMIGTKCGPAPKC
jgi:hypothetical protein